MAAHPKRPELLPPIDGVETRLDILIDKLDEISVGVKALRGQAPSVQYDGTIQIREPAKAKDKSKRGKRAK